MIVHSKNPITGPRHRSEPAINPDADPQAGSTPSPSPVAPADRRALRFAQQAVRCSLGEVRDLSPTGMRVIGKSLPKLATDIDLFTMDKSLRVRGHVVWSRRLEDFRVEMGVVFKNITGRQRQELQQFAAGQHGRTFI